MKTYKELFLFLQSSTYTNIEDWLSCEKWKGKDKQEALFRLCARLGLLHKIKDFSMCCGNFNLNTIQTQTNTRDIFFTHNNKEVCLNDKGDSSDLTGIHKTHPKHLLVCTSKCIRHISIKKLDIDYIGTNFKQYDEKGYTMTLGIVVKDAQEFYSKLERTERTTIELKKFIQRHNTIVIDWKDLNEAYHNFKCIYGKTSFQNLITVQPSPLVLRLHQKLCCLKTMRWKGITNRILWGHIQRSGKSYIIGGVIIEDSLEKPECNYLVITTAPNETILQYLQVLGCSQFGDFNIVRLDGTTKKPVLKNKNIIICSKQFLQTKLDQEPIDQQSREKKQKEEKTRSVPWLKSMRFDMRFVDESHNGGTTELAQKTLEYYGNDSFTVYITATYSKPTHDYQIPREQWILWDLEDINLCKRIDVENNRKRLVEKHGDDMKHLLSQYSTESIQADFSKYPDLDILTMNITPEILPDILENTKTNLYGWSPDACFLLKQGVDENQKHSVVYQPEFQNEKENLKLWHTIFGKSGRFGVPDNDYPDELVFMKRIEKICKNPMTSSRFIGDFDQHVILAFLPPLNIDMVSKTTQQLLEKEQVVPDYEILCINSKTTTDPKQAILDSKIRARNRGKKGVLVLSGKQCSLGVTIDDCDIVLLLNSTQSYDTVFQMMFRCMTEGKGKKRGFVIDLNIHRMIQTILLEYASVVQPNSHPKDAIRYLLQERLINLNSDHWNPCFGHKSYQLTTLMDSIYEIYSSRMSCALENLFKRMSLKHDLFSKNEYDTLKTIFNNHLSLSTSKQKKIVQEETLKKGLEKEQLPIEPSEPIEEETHLNPKDILRPVSIVISLLTIHDNEKTTLGDMFSLLENDEQKKTILLNQVRVWWGGHVSNEDVEGLIRIFGTYLVRDQETTSLIRQVKELFCKNKKNSKELSKIIDKYLIPQENEKKKNAEVSTPLQLRQEMLDTIPVEFWTQKKKVLEPCCGKGGFLMDIVDKFMTGLKKTYPEEKQRYKEIVEDCLYFSDINGMNLFISRLLLDPCNEYKLNYNEGDTIQQLHVQEKWGVIGFDAIIGNPPYNNELWSKFVEWSLCSLCQDGLLLYVHPANWRKPHHKVGQKMLSYDILHLCIYDIKTTSAIFRCNVRVDWYLLRKSKCDTVITTIIDEENKRCRMNIKNSPFIPNCNIELVYGMSRLPGPRLSITRSHSIVSNDKKLVEHSSSVGCKYSNYSYPVITNLNAREKRIRYTDVPHKDHHKPKVVMSYALHLYPFYDEGNLSPTEHVFYQTVKDKDIGLKLVRYLDSSLFKKVLHSCKWIGYQTDHNIFHYLPDISETLTSPDASDLEIRKCLSL